MVAGRVRRGSGAGLMRNGLYSIHVRLGDGRTGKGSGVAVCRDGSLLGGDAFLYYVGTYERRGDTVFGEVVVNQHSHAGTPVPIFGGRQVGIGFSGREIDGRVVLDGTAFAGRESMLFHATLMFLADLPDEPKALPPAG